jgi:hypothetical protein
LSFGDVNVVEVWVVKEELEIIVEVQGRGCESHKQHSKQQQNGNFVEKAERRYCCSIVRYWYRIFIVEQ